ncbi:MAG TPA: HAMP domain-containing sensor histidine kinase [Pirellulales bacterium]|nr:HAMP domain-containing sensor histidine kinase [Pirellulales bacterium]
MLWLPALSLGGGSWRLPLAPHSSAALVNVLALGRNEQALASFTSAIERDPGLAFWAFCRASLAAVRELYTAAALAGWLAESAVDLLDGLQTEEPSDETPHSLLLRAADAWQAPLPDWLQNAIDASSEQDDDQAESSLAEQALPALIRQFARSKRLETAFNEQLETEKLEAMAEFAAGAGHEINNPIAVIAGRAQLFLRSERDPERRRELAVMNAQAMRVYEMISDMMLFARPPEPKPAACDVSARVDRVIDELRSRAADRRIEIVREGPVEPLAIQADEVQLMAAVRALLENSLEALPEGGRIAISLQRVSEQTADREQPHDWLEIAVEDDGPGISPEIRRHLFDPFYSGRGAGRGLGLGLSKCWRIVTNHGGSIDVESEPGRGAKFVIRLPITAAS